MTKVTVPPSRVCRCAGKVMVMVLHALLRVCRCAAVCVVFVRDSAVKVTDLPCPAATSGAVCGEGDSDADLAAAVRGTTGLRGQRRSSKFGYRQKAEHADLPPSPIGLGCTFACEKPRNSHSLCVSQRETA